MSAATPRPAAVPPSATTADDLAAPRLHIAIVTDTYPPEVNGVAMTLGRIVDALQRRGHRVLLVRPRQRQEPTPPPPSPHAVITEMLVRGLPLPGYAGLRFGLPARRALTTAWSRLRPDIVHVVTEGPLGLSAIGAARAVGVPVSSGFHTNFDAYSGHYGFGWLKGLIARYLRHLHNRTDATLVPTRSLAGQLDVQGYRNLAVVSRGVDTRLFHPGRRLAWLRTAWGVAPNDLAVCYVGRMAAEKNLDLVLAAFDAIQRLRPDARLIFVGEGPLRRPLARRFPQHIFAGLQRGTDLAEHYASADLFLFPSLTETFGNVTAEALASGLGVVAYDCAAAADLIADGENGRLAAAGDAEAFIAAACSLAAPDGTALSRVRSRAAKSVADLDWEKVHDNFITTLRQRMVVSRRNSAATMPQRL